MKPLKNFEKCGIIKKEITRNDLQKRIDKVKCYIDNNINNNFDIKVLSDIACMSEFHFIRVFNELCGCTPYQYIIKKRIAKAISLLQFNVYSVFEVSQACGYESVQTFRKCFKRETGYSPRDFNRNQLAVA
jgi:AraC-like DNA-binding protein